MAFFPNEKSGIVVLTNQTNYEAALIIRNTLADRLLELKESKWLEEYQQKIKAMKNTAVTSDNRLNPDTDNTLDSLLYDITGKYLNRGYGEIEIFKEDKTYYTVFRNRKLRIIHKEKDIFHAVRADFPGRMGMPALHFGLGKNRASDRLSIQFETELDPIQFIRQ